MKKTTKVPEQTVEPMTLRAFIGMAVSASLDDVIFITAEDGKTLYPLTGMKFMKTQIREDPKDLVPLFGQDSSETTQVLADKELHFIALV